MRRFLPVFTAAVAVTLTLSLVFYPEDALDAAKGGMKIFFDIVFPSLLPFFILSEVMLGLGVVHFIGVLFEPLMRPVFNTPGESAFALSMGLAAGYPMDAVITARLRRQGLCSRVEAERMLAYTNTADPLFIFGAVAVGMFGMQQLGWTLAAAHYIGALGVGLLFRFYGFRDPGTREARPLRFGGILGRALASLIRARREDGRAVGQLLGDAVSDSVKTLLMICGFIMLFSVFVRMFAVARIDQLVGGPLAAILGALGVDARLVPAAIAGAFEIDLGTVAAAEARVSLVQRALMASAIIAWSGLSVHGQVASVLAGTDIRMLPYAVARLLHAVIAAAATVWLMQGTEAAFAMPPVVVPGFWRHLHQSAALAILLPLGLALAGTLTALVIGGGRLTVFHARRR